MDSLIKVMPLKVITLLLLSLLITACGGGGGSSASTSNWDEMKWDQDNWK